MSNTLENIETTETTRVTLGPASEPLPDSKDYPTQTFANKLKDSIYWWLSSRKPFIVNDQYKIELLVLDRFHNSAKIRVTNLTTNEVVTQEV